MVNVALITLGVIAYLMVGIASLIGVEAFEHWAWPGRNDPPTTMEAGVSVVLWPVLLGIMVPIMVIYSAGRMTQALLRRTGVDL